jgi:hypothetical protein
MQPRIYTYKVTFEEIPHWYWGVHKEKKFGELYLGSPTTNKWFWSFYTPKIQILELFPYTDSGWTQARLVEQRLIRPDLNNPLCLNERCGGTVSIEVARKSGTQAVTNRKGVHSLDFIKAPSTSQYRRNNCLKMLEEKRGIFSEDYYGSERHLKDCRKGGEKSYLERKGLFAEYIGSEEHIQIARSNGKRMAKEKTGIHSPESIAKRSKRVLVKFPDGRINEFESIREASEQTGLGLNTVKRLARGNPGKTYKTRGFEISYPDENRG